VPELPNGNTHDTAKIFPVLLVYCSPTIRIRGVKLDQWFEKLDSGHANVFIALQTPDFGGKRRRTAFTEFG
jgi:hypothetical protein